MKPIYLDNAATTKIDAEVLKAMLPYLKEHYGNASSMHFKGEKAKRALDDSRRKIAEVSGAKPEEIHFTSGGTESNNWALKGLFWKNYPKKNHLVVSKIEHDCILKTCEWLETQGAKVTYLGVDENGFVNLEQLRKAITKKTFLVSIMHANNEIGTIQDIEKIGEICREKGALFHSDACQSFTKVPIDVKKQNVDLLTINSHKISGPKGVGALYIRNGIEITPLLHGGGHERGLRSGTENVAGIVGFAKATELIRKKDVEKMKSLQNELIKKILTTIPKAKLNGPDGDRRLCNNVNLSFGNVEGEAVGGYLEKEGIYVSTGSACMSNTLSSSYVLTALGLTDFEQNSSIRVSLSKYTTEKEINKLIKILPEVIKKLRRISPIS